MNTQQIDEKAVFNTARRIADCAARIDYLGEACGDDAAAIQRVQELLRIHEDQDSFLESPAADLTPTTDLSALIERPGTTIGSYKLLQQIGEGGYGVVFVAEQERPVKRRVAVKVIKPGMDTREVVARFEAERQALAMMDHPNIAKVHDAGATENGRPYFVMELVQGVPITEYCDQCNLPTRERLELFITVCQAVQHAHQKGVIHRDIKPTNVLVAMQDGQPAPKIIDFGVAKAIGQQLTEHTLMTAFAQIVGTPLYMSPEQAELSPLGVDTRSDIYSLGILLYELLTGSTPLDKERLHAASYDELRRIIREEEPLRPSARISTLAADLATTVAEHRRTDTRRLRQTVRGELDWIAMKCLEKDRNRRYESASSVARDVERYLNDEPVQACPPSAAYRFRKFARRNRVALTTVLLVSAALVIGTALSTWQAIRLEQARAESESHRNQAEIARAAETKLRKEAELREAESRQRAYDADINLAQKAIGENRLGLAKSLLASHRPQPGQADLRGWEWRYLWQQTQGDVQFQLCRRNSLLFSLTASFDGRLVALGEAIEGRVSVWDLRSRREVAHLPAGDSEVYVAFSPTAPLLAFSSISGPPTERLAKVQLWDSENQRLVGEILLGARCLGLAFSADGHLLATATAEPEQQIALWQVPGGNKLASFNKPVAGEDEAIPLTVTADMKLAAYGSRGGVVHVCDLTSGRDLWSAKAAVHHLMALAFSPDGKKLATAAGYYEQAIRLWDVESGKETGRLEGHSGWVGGLVFSPDGRKLFSASADRTIRIWDTGKPPQSAVTRILRGHDDEVYRAALLPDGQTLVSCSNDGTVYAWDADSDARRPGDAVVLYGIREWQFTPDSQAVLTVDTHGEVKRWRGPDFARGEAVLDLGRDVNCRVLSADNRWLAIRRNDGSVEVWDLVRGALYRRLAANSEIPWRFLDDGKKLVAFKPGSDLNHVWDVPNAVRLEDWRCAIFPERVLQEGDISPDGRWCLTIGMNGEAVLRDITLGRDEDLQLGVTNPMGVAISADSRMFAVTGAARHRYTKVWEAETKREVATLDGGHGVAFSPDAKRLAIADDGGCSIWNLETRRRLLVLACTGGWKPKFSPDGHVLGCRNEQRDELYLWQAPSPAEIE
jgi:serine/threonine protein kinase/WD40 repeat protein